MSITGVTKLNVQPVFGETDEVALVEPGANLVESTALTLTADAEAADWTYSAIAEDNGTAGALDGQPGVIYNGPSGNAVRVQVTNYDVLEHAITAPEATDRAVMCVFKNSDIVAYADEGFSAVASEIAVEFNVDTVVMVNESDVIRVGVKFTGEVDGDLDLAPGEITLT